MIKYFFILFQGICLALMCQACSSDNLRDKAAGFPLERFTLVSAEGVQYMAYIDQQNRVIEISGIKNSAAVANVSYRLADDAKIYPEPSSLLEKWPQEAVFTITVRSITTQYLVILKDWEEEKDGGGGDDELTPDPAKWQLAWGDDFEGNEINKNAWSKIPRDISDWNNTMADYDELFEVKDGILTLWGMKNTTHSEDASAYLTGGIWGIDKKSFRLGRIEIRAKFDSAQGFWPALWLLPQGGFSANSGDGELDIVEHLNFDNFVYQTLHSSYTNLVDKTKLPNHVDSPIDVNEYNNYGVEVHEDRVVYLVNNKEMFSYPRLYPEVEGQFPFYNGKEFYVILSAQLGGGWVGAVDPELSPVALYVDWVRFYQEKE